MDFNQAQIDQKYDVLPQELRALLDSIEIGDLVAEICDKNGLSPDQVADVMDLTTFTILGLIKPSQFANKLVNELQIDKIAAIKIAPEIDKKLFSKITNTETTDKPQPSFIPEIKLAPKPPQTVNPLEQHILTAINSGVIYANLRKIAEKYNLMLDQVSQLNKDTEKVLIGQIAPESFVKTISTDLEIPLETAKKITADINTEIIMKVRQNLQAQTQTQNQPQPTPKPVPQPPVQQTTQQNYVYRPPVLPPTVEKPVDYSPHPNPEVNAIEKAGGFSIEKTSQNIVSINNTPPAPKVDIEQIEKDHPIPDLEHLLAMPTEEVAKNNLVKGIENPPKIPVQPKPANRLPYSVDPYREEI